MINNLFLFLKLFFLPSLLKIFFFSDLTIFENFRLENNYMPVKSYVFYTVLISSITVSAVLFVKL